MLLFCGFVSSPWRLPFTGIQSAQDVVVLFIPYLVFEFVLSLFVGFRSRDPLALPTQPMKSARDTRTLRPHHRATPPRPAFLRYQFPQYPLCICMATLKPGRQEEGWVHPCSCVCVCVCLHCLLQRPLHSVILCCLNISLSMLAALKSGIKTASKQMSRRNFHRTCSDVPSLMSHRCSLRESSHVKSLFIKINHQPQCDSE